MAATLGVIRALGHAPQELERMHEERQTNRATLGDLALIVLESAGGDNSLHADLARLSSREVRIVATHSGHTIHVEDPDLVVHSIERLVGESAARCPTLSA